MPRLSAHRTPSAATTSATTVLRSAVGTLLVARGYWNTVFCEYPDAALKSRRWAMNHAAETNALVFTTHFAESSAGRVSREGDRLTWHFA